LDKDYLLRLLDEMAAHRMNALSLMMLSYGFFDSNHDGYAWPVTNPKLASYVDPNAVNARPDQEFVRDLIFEAAARDIEIHLFLNWGIWNPEKVKQMYPDTALQQKRGADPKGWLHCPDAPGAWQMGLDEVSDLLSFYDQPNVTSYSFERISYSSGTCFCPYTREAFGKTGEGDIEDAKTKRLDAWKTERISEYLRSYTQHIRAIRPDISVGLHTQCAKGWGHDPDKFKECGIDYLLPHTIQFPTSRKELYRLLKRLEPNPCILHFCSRDRRPANYDLWIKTPEIIDEVLQWVEDYPGDNVEGILFFNEPATSPENKQAVYSGIKRFI
jgi:hypothetical protein